MSNANQANSVGHPIIAITVARLREFIRRPEAVFWVYFFPVLMVIVLGVAFRNQAKESIKVDVVNGPAAAQIAENLQSDDQFKVTILTEEECRLRLRTGKSSLMVRPTGSAADAVEYVFDPVRPGSLTARNLTDNQLEIAAGRTDVIQSSDVEFNEPGGRYVDFLVPGLLGMGLMGGGLWGVGFAIVDMRIRKLLKRFMATPMKRTDFLMAMMLSRLVFMVPQILILLAFSYIIFGVQIFGSYLALVVIVLLGAIEFAGIGLLIGARAQTMESVSGLMNLVMLPMYTLCGIFFSYENFPEVVHPFIKWLPLTPVIDALRAVMLDGETLWQQGPELLVISVWAAVSFIIALLIFRWND